MPISARPLLVFAVLINSLVSGCGAESRIDDSNCDGGTCMQDPVDELPLASDLPEYCHIDDVIRIDRPVASDGAARGTFSYGYRFKAPTTKRAPVLVYLPGGPGETSMETPPAFIPPGWGYLLTDPRGVGCNRLADVPRPEIAGSFFRSEELAQDAIAAIADRKLDHYIVFGLSYGTLLGTLVASDLGARSELVAPIAVVLEGVLGRAFGSDFPGAETPVQWQRVRNVLPADVVHELDTNPTPYRLEPDAWSRILYQLLPMGPAVTANILAQLSTAQPDQTRQQVLDTLASIATMRQVTDPGAVELYRQIACREITEATPLSDLYVVFDHGQLVRNTAEEGSWCTGVHLTTPYDSARYQFTTPVFYFIGDSDVATPDWMGYYHYDHHAGPATKIVSFNAGHNSLEYNQLDCAPALMASIAAGGGDLDQVIPTCPMNAIVNRK